MSKSQADPPHQAHNAAIMDELAKLNEGSWFDERNEPVPESSRLRAGKKDRRDTASFAERRDALEAQRAQIAALARFRRLSYGPGARLGMRLGILLSVVVVGGMTLLARRGELGRDAIVTGSYGLTFAAILGGFAWHFAKRQRRPPAPLADAHVAQHMDRLEREARLALHAEPRLMVLEGWEAAWPRLELNETFFGGLAFGPAFLALCAHHFGVLGGETAQDQRFFASTWPIWTGGVCLVLGLRIRRERRERRWYAAFDELARALSGELLEARGSVLWLNAHWPVESRDEDMQVSALQRAVAAQVHDHDALIDVKPWTFGGTLGQLTKARVLVYLATPLPPGFQASPVGQELRATLSQRGFKLECREGAGLIARALPKASATIMADPSTLAELSAILQALAAAARDSRG